MEHEIWSAIGVHTLVFVVWALLGLPGWVTLKKKKAPLPASWSRETTGEGPA